MNNDKQCGTTSIDMTKKIVMGPYYKYDEQDEWFSDTGYIGEVRVIEDILCYAVQDIEYFDEERYDIFTHTNQSYKKVMKWVPYFDSTE